MASQHDLVIDNQTFPSFRSDLNAALQALGALSWGPTAPSTTYAYQWWADSTTGLLKIRNAANSGWITVGTLASANLGLLAESMLTTRGDIITRGASASQRVGVGTAQQILRSDGTDPAWAALITALTEDTSPAYDDFLLSRDVSASLDKKILIKNLLNNVPSFKVHKNGTAQSGIASATDTKVTWATAAWDIGSLFDLTNERWVPPASREIELRAKIGVSGGQVDQADIGLMLFKNGSNLENIHRPFSGTGTQSAEIFAQDVTGSGGTDYYELFVTITGAGTKTILGGSGATSFSGRVVR